MTKYKTIDEIVAEIENFNDEHYLSHGNGEVFCERNGQYFIYSVIEGFNHTTLTVVFDEQLINKMMNGNFLEVIRNEYINVLDEFDVDETFAELWSKEFSEHNSFTPTSFLEILKEDKEHFIDAKFALT
ncbi:hypothetical protein [Staphylococcus shinii]|uniref:hypothetical protein n=1 Tax=Staphylococcus shinii TaxID=2912228 RepID=UPI00351869F0